jgi:hypothetical protein
LFPLRCLSDFSFLSFFVPFFFDFHFCLHVFNGFLGLFCLCVSGGFLLWY